MMKTGMLACSLIFLFFAQPLHASGEKPKVGDVSVSGFYHIVYTKDDKKHIALKQLRVRFDYSAGKTKVFSEIEVADKDKWLRQLWLGRENSVVGYRFGRLFLSAGGATPPPFLLKTVNYSIAVPFNAYAYGAQMNLNFVSGAKISIDVSAQSGEKFDDSANWKGMEISSRLIMKPDIFQWGVTVQLAQEMQKFGIDIEYDVIKRLWFSGGVYGKTGKDRDTLLSTYALADWAYTSKLHVHSRLDYRQGYQSDDFIVTNGIQWVTNETISLTVDYQSVLEGKAHRSALLARFQARF